MGRCPPLLLVAITALICAGPLRAQVENEYGEDSKLNTNLAVSFSAPLIRLPGSLTSVGEQR